MNICLVTPRFLKPAQQCVIRPRQQQSLLKVLFLEQFIDAIKEWSDATINYSEKS